MIKKFFLSFITFSFSMLAFADASMGFGLGDEGQQLQQMQQLQTTANVSNSNGPRVVLQNTQASSSQVDNSSSTAFLNNQNQTAVVAQAALSPNDVSSASDAAPVNDNLVQTQPPTIFAAPYTGAANRINPLPQAAQIMNEAAFNDVITSTFPMTGEQIHQLKQVYYASQAAAAAPPGVPPKPTVTSQVVSIAPGSTPPVVRLAQGFVSSLVFVDSTGAPWPLEAYDIGNPAAFNIQWNHTDNTLMIQSMSLYTYGNLAVRLKGLSTPVMLTLIPGQRVVDYRVDLRIQGLGPNAKILLGDGLPTIVNPELLGVLDGVPPRNAKNMVVAGGEAQAWLAQDKLFLRTRLTVLSPAWTSIMSSPDGMNAYEFQKTPMILASFHGKPIQLRIEGF
ncbi:MAG: hypothetical protein A3I12_00520 [Gammaproteobacteria bacterium RIFCSPLOWO2_02_FULL_38_11]|nr:MAG: hypothetical protein A3B69_00605 [Gammaproteobacteria bacterium RIFCSPHIGHO2_02_FULL_38_33]OGT24645.1 MAG: hypothetical protein A2W47_06175 [Gammaproteobacteria bacterium RIFCSPHIGHO2_12_38_15]OGT67958.1 MAG: hypothetical protein A3I12_00520 [Gammaproteobacteria bacterium RIFCSPLOWO2_02_FULL_38_11]OGT77787.1 MAG: hypothetical protein A3G71_06080 [Gammaproteobacteria bacterium RIFCSPLOWO2_12_FULL_38_14]